MLSPLFLALFVIRRILLALEKSKVSLYHWAYFSFINIDEPVKSPILAFFKP